MRLGKGLSGRAVLVPREQVLDMEQEMDLFAAAASQGQGASGAGKSFAPLAQRMRPRNFQEFIGQ